MDTTTIIETLVKIIDRLTKQPGTLSVRSTVALERIGDILMDQLQPIRDAIQRQADKLADTLTTEIGQITAKLSAVVSMDEVQGLVDEIDQKTETFAQQIRDIVPDQVPDPVPEP